MGKISGSEVLIMLHKDYWLGRFHELNNIHKFMDEFNKFVYEIAPERNINYWSLIKNIFG